MERRRRRRPLFLLIFSLLGQGGSPTPNKTTNSVGPLPTPLPLLSLEEGCRAVFAFDTVGPYRQEERMKERIYYYRDDDENSAVKDEFGLVCFTNMINCTVPAVSLSKTLRKIPHCMHFEKEFCTRKYGQMRWKGKVCPTRRGPHPEEPHNCPLPPGPGNNRPSSSSSAGRNETPTTPDVGRSYLICRNSYSLCLSLKPPFYSKNSGGSERNPPTQSVCLCPLGYTGADCARIDVDLFQLDLLRNVDLRNILLKYQQKDRYFIGVTLLFLLITMLGSVLLVVAGCSYLYRKVPGILKGKRVKGRGRKVPSHRVSMRKGEEGPPGRLPASMVEVLAPEMGVSPSKNQTAESAPAQNS